MSDHPIAVIYGQDSNAEALIDHVEGTDYILLAWRGRRHGRWISSDTGRGTLTISSCEPHPDPDRALADYVAWRLTQ